MCDERHTSNISLTIASSPNSPQMTNKPTLSLIRPPRSGPPARDTAISHAVLRRVAAGELGATLRLRVAEPVLAFGKQDANSPGYARAVAAARGAGFDPVLRLAGGRAAVFHRGTIAFAHATPEDRPTRGTRERFERTGDWLVAALVRLGVDARVGEVPGEYCPGAFSVNAGGRIKIAGVGQRLISGAAHVGGVVVVNDGDAIRDVLIPVYDALGLEWDPATAGSIEDEVPGVSVDDAIDAMLSELADRHELVEGSFEDATLALAEELEDQHEVAA
jgi:octanoyl-[GcvH]:protein N-octanoyltransferase